MTCKTCLIERNIFTREGIKSLLAKEADFDLTSEISCIEKLEATHQEQSFNLIIIGLDQFHQGAKNSISKMKSIMPEAAIIVLSDSADKKSMREIYMSGADGFIKNDISAEAFMGYLNLVMAGERVFPTLDSAFLEERSGFTPAFCTKAVSNRHHLSEREIEIIVCLTNGESNKLIAKKLKITESTVKVHLKTILRKLGLDNRTQAAIWGVSQGLVASGEQAHYA